MSGQMGYLLHSNGVLEQVARDAVREASRFDGVHCVASAGESAGIAVNIRDGRPDDAQRSGSQGLTGHRGRYAAIRPIGSARAIETQP